MTDVREAFSEENLADACGRLASLPVVAISIPNVGELSRKERDEIKTAVRAIARWSQVIRGLQAAGKELPRGRGKIRETGAKPMRTDLLVPVVASQASMKPTAA